MVLSLLNFNRRTDVLFMLLKSAIFTSILLTSCRKIGDDDPLISLRSRESRILGKWRVTRLYYFDGKLGGLNHDGDTFKYNRQLNADNSIVILDTAGNKFKEFGNWYWLEGNQSANDFETICIRFHGIPIAEKHTLTRLSKKQIISIVYFDQSNKKRYFRHIWERI